MSFWSAWWRRRAAGVPDTARPAHGRADGDDRSGKAGRQAAATPEAVQDAATPQDGIAVELRGLAMRFGAVEALRGLDARIVDRPARDAEGEAARDAEWVLKTYEPRIDLDSVDITQGDNGDFGITAKITQ